MFNKEALPTANLRKTLLKFEILEIGALIGTGGFAVIQGELLPTVMAVGTLAGLAAWHAIHIWNDRKSNQTALPMPQTEIEGGLSEAAELPTALFLPDDAAVSIQETLDAIHDGDLFPKIIGTKKHSRRRIAKRLSKTSPRHS